MFFLLGTVDRSNVAPNGINVRERLQSVLVRINREGSDILSPHTLTVGMEFQAVYSGMDRLFDHLWLIQYELHPVVVRFSIGIGEITTDINREHAIGMDGPAFDRARRGMKRLSQEKHLFAITGQNGECSVLVDRSLRLISSRMKSWEKNRYAVLYGLSRGRAVREIADFLQISERSVYKNIRAGELDVILDIVREIARRSGSG